MISPTFCLLLAVLYHTASASPRCNSHKQVIVAVLPDDDYYNNSYPDIIDFIQQMANNTQGLDHFIVLYDERWDEWFHNNGYDSIYDDYHFGLPFGDDTLRIVTNYPLDLWARDFGLIAPENPVKFRYAPQYLSAEKAKLTDKDFDGLLENVNAKVRHSKIALDGGNVVDNNYDKAIITERVLKENKGMTKQELKQKIESLINMKVALIPDPGPKDTTGHSDGLVSFIEDNKVLIGYYNDDDYYHEIEDALAEAFPEVQTIKVHCEQKSRKREWRGFSTAIGGYVNILVTNNAAYVPQFGNAKCDKYALDLVEANTHKTVVPIDTSQISHMGGSVRCLTFQVESCSDVGQRLLNFAFYQTIGF